MAEYDGPSLIGCHLIVCEGRCEPRRCSELSYCRFAPTPFYVGSAGSEKYPYLPFTLDSVAFLDGQVRIHKFTMYILKGIFN